jgi:hypothetical protein
MYFEKFQSAAGSKIAVTNTATSIFDLVNTSQSTSLANAGFSSGVNALIIQPEDGDVRLLFDGNSPTTTNGFLVKSNSVGFFPNVPLRALKLIRVGGTDVNCSIMVGKSDAGEGIALDSAGSGSGTVATEIQGNVASGATDVGNPVKVGGRYNAAPPTFTNGQRGDLQLNASGELKVAMDSDIQIGAVELKNAVTDDRALISDANTARATTDHVLSVQQLAADGTVPPSGSLLTNAPFTKITDGTSNLTLGTGTVKTVPSQVHDGTTGATVETGTKKALNVNITDGTNDMPTMDVNTRAGFQKITDGTNDVSVSTTTIKGLNTVIGDGENTALIVADTADGIANAGFKGINTITRLQGYNGATWDRVKATSGALDVNAVGNVASGATDAGNPVKVGGKYNATLPTIADGQRGDLQVDANGRLIVAEAFTPLAEDNANGVMAVHYKPIVGDSYAWTPDISAALEASSVAKATSGTIRYFAGRIDSTLATGTYYLQFLNHSSLPADGAVTMLCAPIKVQHTTGTDSPIVIDFKDSCIYASTGITWCLSTTEFTKTISTAHVSSTFLYK